jgi:hypothetical protein
VRTRMHGASCALCSLRIAHSTSYALAARCTSVRSPPFSREHGTGLSLADVTLSDIDSLGASSLSSSRAAVRTTKVTSSATFARARSPQPFTRSSLAELEARNEELENQLSSKEISLHISQCTMRSCGTRGRCAHSYARHATSSLIRILLQL